MINQETQKLSKNQTNSLSRYVSGEQSYKDANVDLQPCRRQRIVWVLPLSAKLLPSRPLLFNLKRERPAN